MLKWVFLQCPKPGRARLIGPSAGLLVVLIGSETTSKKGLKLWQARLREFRPQSLVHVFGALVGALKVCDNHACQGFRHLRTTKIDCEAFISVPVRVSDTHRTLVIATKADREVRDKRASQGSRHARKAYNGVKDEPRHALISVPARASGAPRATQHGPRCAC